MADLYYVLFWLYLYCILNRHEITHSLRLRFLREGFTLLWIADLCSEIYVFLHCVVDYAMTLQTSGTRLNHDFTHQCYTPVLNNRNTIEWDV